MNYFQTLIDLVFPKTCLHCERSLSKNEQFLCSDCEQYLEFLEKICPVCGAPNSGKKCRVCKTNDFQFDKARSVFLFNESVQKLIHEFKYNEMTRIAKFFARFAQDYLNRYQPFEHVDCIAPVPLHKVRKRERGFNQAEYLTREISKFMNWKHIPKLVKRKRFTETQTKLKKIQRKENVSEAFSINNKFKIKGKNILLIDDVFTTGATTNSIAEILKENQVNKVYVLTIGRAL